MLGGGVPRFATPPPEHAQRERDHHQRVAQPVLLCWPGVCEQLHRLHLVRSPL